MDAILRGALVWLGIALLAVLNGGFREAVLKRSMGVALAHVVSTLLLTAIIIAVAFVSIGWIGAETLWNAWMVGMVWVIATLAFEFLLGHFAFGNPWTKIVEDYNVSKGRVWILVPICTLFAPALALRGLESAWAIPYLVSNAIGIAILLLSVSRPMIARWMLAVLFVYAGVYNLWLASTSPNEYLNFANFVLIPWYREFILGPFAANAALFISSIAVGQLLIAISLGVGRKLLPLGAIGVSAFLLGIAPFGVGSAFPFSITVSLAALIVAFRAQPA